MKQIKLESNENQGIRYQWAADDSQQCYRRILRGTIPARCRWQGDSRHHGREGGSLHAKAGCCRTCGESPHGQTERKEQECQLPMVGTDTDAFVCPVLSGERRKGTCGYTVVSSGLSTQPDTCWFQRSVSRIKTVEGRKIRSEIQATAYSTDFRRCNVFFIDLL